MRTYFGSFTATLHMLVLAIAFAGGAAVVEGGCGGNISVKQQVDRADRTAFESLRALQKLEGQAYAAKLPWPTAQQHRDINSKLSAAYLLVIDVANAALALKAGDPLPASLAAASAQLEKLVADIVSLASPGPFAVVDAAKKAQTDTRKLTSTATPGGKQ